MSSMNIDSPTSLASLPMARRFNRIQKKKNSNLIFGQHISSSQSSSNSSSSQCLSSTSTSKCGSNKMKMALLNQLSNQQSLNDLPIGFDNAYDYIEESAEHSLLPSIEEYEHSQAQDVYSTTSCMEEEEEYSLCNLKRNNLKIITNEPDMMRNSNTSMLMSQSTASNVSTNNQQFSSHSNMMMMSSSSCMTAVKANTNNRQLRQFTHSNYFMDEEEENYFCQLENKINDWLDAEGVLQVEPNSRKMNTLNTICINNPYSSSSLIQRRKLRNLSLF